MRRGEVWTATGGVYTPVVIAQDNRFDATDSVTVLPMTTALVEAPLLRVLVEPTTINGLERASHVMIDKITTTRRTKVQSQLGILSREDMVRIERSLLVFLGLAG